MADQRPLAIALIGYGRMGKEIEALAPSRNITVGAVFDENNLVTESGLTGIDVCIDFSIASAVLRNVTIAAEAGRNIVVGTTGWEADRESAAAVVRHNRTAMLVASNFSVGVNIFFSVVSAAARLVNGAAMYDSSVHEIHHRMKKDSPSGTALSIAQILCRELAAKTEILAGSPDGAIHPSQLQITSQRNGSVVGTHSVLFDSEADAIELTHTAKNRSGFALGALLAAEWINGKQGLFTMQDVLSL